MKLHKNLVNSLATALQDIFIRDRYADKTLEKLFRDNPRWGSRDRRFIAEGVYDTVRNYRLYAALAESEKNFWFIAGVWMLLKDIEIPEWQEFIHFDRVRVLRRKETLEKEPVYAYSYPDWLWELGVSELGRERWLREVIAMHEQAQVYLRANTLKVSVDGLKEEFEKDGIAVRKEANAPEALRLEKRSNVFQHRLFKEGWFEVQDIGSQQIGEFVSPRGAGVVIDACAGAGGKSLHLAALMKNKGRIYSLDVDGRKLEELKKRARRAGAFNIETRTIDSDAVIASLAGVADKVLLDVPCSGLGVLKRNPDAKWKLSPETIARTRRLQAKILSEYSVIVKPGGELIYSTCSLLPSENRGQVDAFLSGNTAFVLDGEKTLFPSEGGDGFYMVRLMRKA